MSRPHHSRVERTFFSSARTSAVMRALPRSARRNTCSRPLAAATSSWSSTPASKAACPTDSVEPPTTRSRPALSVPARSIPRPASASRSASGDGVRTSTSRGPLSSSASVPWRTRWPRERTTTSSTVCWTSLSTWLETSTVRPSAASARRNCRSQAMPAGSSPLAGSSRISTSGSPSRAPASASRCRMPRLYPPTRLPATSARPTCASIWSARSRACAPVIPAPRPITSRCARALRPGWKLDASSEAPTVPMGSSRSR